MEGGFRLGLLELVYELGMRMGRLLGDEVLERVGGRSEAVDDQAGLEGSMAVT